jgi:hypothetical protein
MVLEPAPQSRPKFLTSLALFTVSARAFTAAVASRIEAASSKDEGPQIEGERPS